MSWALPANAGAVAANLTTVNAPGFAFLTAFPGGTPLPNSSNINTSRAGDVVAAQSVTRLRARESRGSAIKPARRSDFIIDITGVVHRLSAAAARRPAPRRSGAP